MESFFQLFVRLLKQGIVWRLMFNKPKLRNVFNLKVNDVADRIKAEQIGVFALVTKDMQIEVLGLSLSVIENKAFIHIHDESGEIGGVIQVEEKAKRKINKILTKYLIHTYNKRASALVFFHKYNFKL